MPDPTAAPPENGTQKTQEDKNLEVYGRVLQKCYRKALEIAGEAPAGKEWTQEQVHQCARALFERHFADQLEIKAARLRNAPLGAQVDLLAQALAGRRPLL